MTIPTEAWTAINTFGLLGIAFLAFLQNRKVREIKQIVDGPLSLALRSNAELAAKVAESSGKHEDLMAAAKAKILSENREAGKAEAPQK